MDSPSIAALSRSLSALAPSDAGTREREDGAAGIPLQLPVDGARSASSEVCLESVAFSLAIPDASLTRLTRDGGPARIDALVVAAFCLQLARWCDRPTVPLDVRRAAVSPMRRSRRVVTLATAGATLRTLIDDAARGIDRAGDADAPPAGDRVALTWIDDLALAPEGELDALALAASVAPAEDVVLQLIVAMGGDEIRAALVHDASLLDARSVARLAARLGRMVGDAALALDAPARGLDVITREERAWIAAACEGRPRVARALLAHRRIEELATTTPLAIAVRWRDRTLDYRGLDARASQVARRLAALGVSAEQRVVVCLEPSIDVAIAVLAIWKAGGAYVPVDPSLPVARVRAIVEDTTPAAVISRADLAERLELGSPLVTLDDPSLEELATEPLDLEVDAGQTASVYYTSGTTGRPKGVMASHANVASYVGVAIDRYGFGPGDVMPAIARFGFSISMLELMMPLVAGGTLVVLDRDQVLDPAALARALGEVTFFHAGPSLLKTLLAHVKRSGLDPQVFSRVRHASSGGDMVPPEVLEGLKATFREAEVFVIYGCSEISCMGCTWPVPRDRVVTRTLVGRPFDGVAVKVLDADLREVPAGAVGEIHFAGVGVTRGYLDRPELTEEKFVTLDGRRFYRTGDVGRLDADGWIEMLGRRDFQVKVRGMRIELPEVEHHLRRAPGVRDGVVSARDTVDGEKALVAYVVPDPEDSAESGRARRVAEVRRFMSEHVPDYMVPSIYVELAALPLNHNLKVDRLALPPPGTSGGSAATRTRPPETAVERRLSELWCRLLGVATVGLDDNFFELGGHSILAVELIHEVQAALGVELDGMTVLREPLEVQAGICERLTVAASTPGPVSRERVRSRPVMEPRELFHFGRDHELYGVLHRPLESAGADAVVLCAPVGQDHVRADFVLQRLATCLAARGVPVLRFDWFGTRDALGESHQATCTRWGRDIEDACAELARRTRASRVTAIGVRLGATLLWQAAPRLDLERIVLWDPIGSGAAHRRLLVDLHARILRTTAHLRGLRRPRRTAGRVELAGMEWSEEALRELDALAITPHPRPVYTSCLLTAHHERERALVVSALRGQGGSPIESLEVDCRWNEVSQQEDILPDVGISERLAAMAVGSR